MNISINNVGKYISHQIEHINQYKTMIQLSETIYKSSNLNMIKLVPGTPRLYGCNYTTKELCHI